jgi:Glycosyltransferase family 87
VGLRRRLADARRAISRGRALAAGLLEQGSRANRRLTLGLGIILGALCLLGLRDMILGFPAGIDFEIPLRAASRWVGGGEPYPPSAMLVNGGPDLPFLYPPYLLPLLAPVAGLPRNLVIDVWLILCAASAVWTCRRLAMPWLAIPAVLAWPPFSEGLVTGNAQILSFAALVALLYEPADGIARQRTFLPSRDALNGVMAAAVGVLKVAQSLPLLYLIRRRPRAALVSLAALAALTIALLPLTGVSVYGDWLAQLRRAADPSWTIGGVALGRSIGLPDFVLVAVGVALALSVRGRDSAAWLGIAMLIATPSVHGYTFLFLVPSLLAIRRDFAFAIAAFYLGVYHTDMWWIGCSLAVGCLLAANRWPWLRVAAPAIQDNRSGGGPASSSRRSQDPPIQSDARYNLLDLAIVPSIQPRSSQRETSAGES